MGIVSLTTFNATAENAVKPYWQDVQVVAVNKEYPRTVFMTYDNRDDALSGKFERSKYYRLLNGTWKFMWSADPEKRPADFYKSDFDVSGWDDIAVPGTWQLQGYGKPIYTNWTYPFKKDQPRVTGEPPKHFFSYENRNPVGS